MIPEIWLLVSVIITLFTLYYFYELLRDRHEKYILYWDITSFLISLFLVIFGFYGYFYITKVKESEIPAGVLVYFFSAIFVLFVLRQAYKIITQLKKNEERFRDLALKSEYETKQKTVELEKKIGELEKSRSAMINILEDISEQKETIEKSEKNLELMNVKLEKSNKALLALDEKKNQFTSIAAHELKTPLASIHGFIQLLQKEEIIEDKEKRKRYMNIVITDAERLSKLVTDILDISRMDMGTLKLEPETIFLKDFLLEIENIMDPMMKEKKITAAYALLDGCPEKIVLDKTRLSQVILNLISNALHYSREGGKIDVKVRRNGNNLLFYVSDTGIGIAKEEQEKIFEKFYQVDNWLTRKIGGSGLGLAISRGIVSAFGGKIWVESELGKGATFYVAIPLLFRLPHE